MKKLLSLAVLASFPLIANDSGGGSVSVGTGSGSQELAVVGSGSGSASAKDEVDLLVAAVIIGLQEGSSSGDGSSVHRSEHGAIKSRSRSRSRSTSPVATIAIADVGSDDGSGSEGFDRFSSPVDVVSGENGSGDDAGRSREPGFLRRERIEERDASNKRLNDSKYGEDKGPEDGSDDDMGFSLFEHT